MEYSAVIRTLGKSGKFYQTTLDSLSNQTIRPSAVFVYIAENYPLPKETNGIEQYVYVKKGMLAQRALSYKEVNTDYILFLDDDVYLPENAVEILYKELKENDGQIIAPCVFYNNLVPVKDKIRLTIFGREVCRLFGQRWGYKVLRNGSFSYCNSPRRNVYESQTNSGPCFFCKKKDFLKIHLEDETWVDNTYYAFPEDQVTYYKMYKYGLRILTSYDSGIVHLDASTTVKNTEEKTLKLIFSEYRNKLIFWHRFIFLPEKNLILKGWATLTLLYTFGLQILNYGLKYLRGNKQGAIVFKQGLIDGLSYIKSADYKKLPLIKN